MYKKVKTGISILIVALLIGTPLSGSSPAMQDADETKNEEDLPDLTITNIERRIRHGSRYYAGIIKNIGEATFNGNIKVKIRVTKNMFLHKKITMTMFCQIKPGDSAAFPILSVLPTDMLVCFDAEVNPDHKIKESNYENNEYQETFLAYDKQGAPIEERNKDKNNQFFNLFQNPDTNSFLNNMFNNQPLFNSFQSNQRNNIFSDNPVQNIFKNFNISTNTPG